jgi:predicted  nucleic acid-binding Zn-ribbon protein
MKDSIVESIVAQYQQRAEFGYKKYGVTMDREDLDIQDWIEHAKQEAMDFTLYLEKLSKEIGHKENIIENLLKVIKSQEQEIAELNKDSHLRNKRAWHY